MISAIGYGMDEDRRRDEERLRRLREERVLRQREDEEQRALLASLDEHLRRRRTDESPEASAAEPFDVGMERFDRLEAATDHAYTEFLDHSFTDEQIEDEREYGRFLAFLRISGDEIDTRIIRVNAGDTIPPRFMHLDRLREGDLPDTPSVRIQWARIGRISAEEAERRAEEDRTDEMSPDTDIPETFIPNPDADTYYEYGLHYQYVSSDSSDSSSDGEFLISDYSSDSTSSTIETDEFFDMPSLELDIDDDDDLITFAEVEDDGAYIGDYEFPAYDIGPVEFAMPAA